MGRGKRRGAQLRPREICSSVVTCEVASSSSGQLIASEHGEPHVIPSDAFCHVVASDVGTSLPSELLEPASCHVVVSDVGKAVPSELLEPQNVEPCPEQYEVNTLGSEPGSAPSGQADASGNMHPSSPLFDGTIDRVSFRAAPSLSRQPSELEDHESSNDGVLSQAASDLSSQIADAETLEPIQPSELEDHEGSSDSFLCQAAADLSSRIADAEILEPPGKTNDGDEIEVKEPEHIECPLTYCIFRDPVFVPESGNTYEREAIMRFWASTAPQQMDPLTNMLLTESALHTNWGMRREVRRFLDSYPTYVPRGWLDRQIPGQTPSINRNDSRRSAPWRATLLIAVGLVLAIAGTVSLKRTPGVFHEVLPEPHVQEPPVSQWDSFFARVGGAMHTAPSMPTGFFPELPKGSRMIVSGDAERFAVRLPPGGITIDALGQACFASLWFAVTLMSTIAMLRSRAPAVFLGLTAVFWGIEGAMVTNLGRAVLATEVLEVDEYHFTMSVEALGYILEKEHGDITQLQPSPRVECDDWDTEVACHLVLHASESRPRRSLAEPRGTDHLLGASSRLGREDAEWLRRLLERHLTKAETDMDLSGSLRAFGLLAFGVALLARLWPQGRAISATQAVPGTPFEAEADTTAHIVLGPRDRRHST